MFQSNEVQLDLDVCIFYTVMDIIICLSGWGFIVVYNFLGKSLLMFLFLASVILEISILDYREKEKAKQEKEKEEQKKRNEQYAAQRYYPTPHANRY